MPPRNKNKKAAEVVDPAVAEAEARRKTMVKEAAALHLQLTFEQNESASMQFSNFQTRRNWVRLWMFRCETPS
jgi:hypothetical protein